MRRFVGRPMKYGHLIRALDDHMIYSPGKIARFAVEHGLAEGNCDETRKLSQQRIRIAMGRFSNNHDFPDEGDGMVLFTGQAPTPGWFGWRWKASALR